MKFQNPCRQLLVFILLKGNMIILFVHGSVKIQKYPRVGNYLLFGYRGKIVFLLKILKKDKNTTKHFGPMKKSKIPPSSRVELKRIKR